MSKENYSVNNRIKKGLQLLWFDIKNMKWVIIFIIAYFVFLKKFLYSLCPLVLLTGYPCPTCGMTRAGFLLLHFDFAGAFHVHPFIYPVVLVMALFIINRYLLLRKTSEWMKWVAIAVIIGILIFYIWRMYTYFPGEPPMSYYYNNLLNRL